jgi:hypothetical protein
MADSEKIRPIFFVPCSGVEPAQVSKNFAHFHLHSAFPSSSHLRKTSELHHVDNREKCSWWDCARSNLKRDCVRLGSTPIRPRIHVARVAFRRLRSLLARNLPPVHSSTVRSIFRGSCRSSGTKHFDGPFPFLQFPKFSLIAFHR